MEQKVQIESAVAHGFATVGVDKSSFSAPAAGSFGTALPSDSPIADIALLSQNWDGEGAEPPGDITISRAQELWDYAAKLAGHNKDQLPHVYPGREGNICFLWKGDNKRLDVFLHCGCPLRAEYALEICDREGAGECQTLISLERIVRRFAEA